jgi:hypothetical protein
LLGKPEEYYAIQAGNTANHGVIHGSKVLFAYFSVGIPVGLPNIKTKGLAQLP